jgi:enoyl-CoA hydratase/carnithine racemase
LRFGLINEHVFADALHSHTLALARKLADKSALTLATGKAAFYRQAELPLAEAYAYAQQVMVDNLATQDAQEGIAAFIEKRPPTWCGA